MPILYAEIQVAGLSAGCAVADFHFYQITDYEGRPNSTVRVGLLQVTLTGEEAAWPVWETLMFDPYRRESGHLVFFQGEGQKAKQVTFYNAALVHYECRFDARSTDGATSFQTELHFSAATTEVQGQRLEAHSLIPWATDEATRFRALTKPPELRPSATLAAIMRSGTLKAETVASSIIKRVVTPAGEVATEVLGLGATAIARAASLTAALVLAPANDPNAPGYDADKNFSAQHPTIPPDPDAFRLAQLEAAHLNKALTTAEEAEYITLLAKVKGIHVHSLADLYATGPLRGETVHLPEFYIIPLSYTKRPEADLDALRRKFNSSARKSFLKHIGSDPATVQRLRKAGLDDATIDRIASGKCPSGYQVHHKVPLDDGGDNRFDNLMLIKNDPYHLVVTNVQNTLTGDLQAGQTRVVQWPICNDIIYPPTPQP
ncbi:type VI secretion system tube protein TssD [Hymenobacter norwichensis]|uniref:type VI secretion system tube protein TssD n=1 Tax=Hymenobacter norwichensis TaxID=223903 RepID=UPI0012FAF051|nr:type VI secretion system tube protein TssD [Hymenobacter norwichensis]